MSAASFKFMVWAFKLVDVFSNPRGYLAKVPLEEGMTVVDYGCGPGRYTIPVAEFVGTKGRVLAVDIQPLAIETVMQKAADKRLTNIMSVLVDSYQTGIQDESVDMVLLIDVIHSISDYTALFHEIHRILKPHGLLFIEPSHMKASEAKELAESSGFFTLVKCEGKSILLARN
jgi:ubiquinone/menaquinone biosynthesis C-methylase UbiE